MVSAQSGAANITMGSVFRKNSAYYIDYRYQGKRYRKKIGSSKKLAKLALKDVELKIVRGELGLEIKEYPIDEVLESYIDFNQTNHSKATQNAIEQS